MNKTLGTLLAALLLAGVFAAPASASMVPMNFADVSEENWYYDAVSTLYDKGLVSGVAAPEFGPDGEEIPGLFGAGDEMTRAMFVTLLGRVADRMYWIEEDGSIGYYEIVVENPDEYYDLDPSATWYVRYMQWAYEQGIISGHGDGVLAPDEPITREQMAVFLYNFTVALDLTLPGTGGDGPLFPYFLDFIDISDWAYEAVEACYESGLLSGLESNGRPVFRPAQITQRAQATQAVANLLEVCDINVPAGDLVFR